MGYTLLPVLPRSYGSASARPASASVPIGFDYYETDTKRKLVNTAEGWLKTNGQWEYLISTNGPGAQVTNGTTATIANGTLSTPSNLYGPLLVVGGMMWSATNNAAGFLLLIIDGVECGRFRLHNQSTGFGVFKSASWTGTYMLPRPGTYTYEIRVSADGGGVAIQAYNPTIEIKF